MKKSLAFLLLVFLHVFIGNVVAYSQGKLELLPGSEKMYFDKNTQTHRLVGNVGFTYQGNTMFCDSAHYKENQKIVKAFGNVHITKDDINLYCDSMFYSGAQRFARLWGHVNVRDSEYKLTSDSAEYDSKTGKATYRNYGKIENSLNKEKITSKVGYFYPATRSYFFSGKVKYVKEDLSIATDTLQFAYEKQTTYFYGPTLIKNDSIQIKCERGFYNIEKQEGELRKNVEIAQKYRRIFCDTANYKELHQDFLGRGHVRMYENNQHLILFGDRFHSQNNVSATTLNGHALVVETGHKDSLFIHAETITMFEDSTKTERTVCANHKVKIFSKQIQAIGDSATYVSMAGTLILQKSPILWSNNGELKGDEIHVYLKDSVIDKAEVKGNATAILEVEKGIYYNQLSGKNILAKFKNSTLDNVKVNGNAWTIFYPVDEEANDTALVKTRMGLNRLFASELLVYLDSGEVSRITYFDKPDGIFFPIDQIDESEKRIQGFSWSPFLRPRNPWEMVHSD